MSRLADSLYVLLLTLWVGGLWTIGFIVAPSLFAALKDRVLAGELAGNLFGLIAWIGIASAAYLVGYLLACRRRAAFKSGFLWVILLMLALTLAGHFGIQPILAQLKAEAWPRGVMDSAVKSRFATWHGVASGLYVLQSLLGAVAVLLQRKA